MQQHVWTVEYSAKEGYHVSTLPAIIQANLRTVQKGIEKDYLLIGIFKNIDDAHDFITAHEKNEGLSEITITDLIS